MSNLNQYGPMKKIIEGVREVYLGLLARHLPGEAFDLAREVEVTQIAFDGVAEQFLSLIAYAEAHSATVVPPSVGNIESWEDAYERQRQYWGEHDKTPYMLAELNARRAQASGVAATGPTHTPPFKVVNITSPGYEGWANVIYTGPACEGLCIAMVPPYVAKDLRDMLAALASVGLPFSNT